jgi:hypothetical protein
MADPASLFYRSISEAENLFSADKEAKVADNRAQMSELMPKIRESLQQASRHLDSEENKKAFDNLADRISTITRLEEPKLDSEKMAKVQAFIERFADVVYPNPDICSSFAQAKLILIGDEHNLLAYQANYMKLINATADKNTIILLEMFGSMHPVNKEESVWIRSLKAPVKAIYGWDLGKAEDMSSHPFVIESEQYTRMLLDLEEKAKNRPLSSEEQAMKIELTRKFKEMAQKWDFNLESEIENQLDALMPERTASMIITLKKALELEDVSKVYLIAGKYHIREKEREKGYAETYNTLLAFDPTMANLYKPEPPDPRLNLDSLREYLKDKPVMMLFPK